MKRNIPLILGIILLFLLAGSAYYLTQGKRPTNSTYQSLLRIYSSPTSSSVAVPPKISCTTTNINLPVNWKTYANQEFEYSLGCPPEFEFTNEGKNSILMTKKSNEPGSIAPNFIYISVIPKGTQSTGGDIYNYNTPEANILLNMKVGEVKSFSRGSDQVNDRFFTYTRLPNTTIVGLPAKTYINTSPWESPQGTKEYRYYVDRGNNTYLMGGYVEGKFSPQIYYISEQLFQQILSTFKFVN